MIPEKLEVAKRELERWQRNLNALRQNAMQAEVQVIRLQGQVDLLEELSREKEGGDDADSSGTEPADTRAA